MIYLIVIIFILVAEHALLVVVERANVSHVRLEVPDEFAGIYDREKYAKSQNYLKDNSYFKLLSSGVFLVLLIAFIVLGGFNAIDRFARSFGLGMVGTGLIFTGTALLLGQIADIPFNVYHTFVIEQRYGFNRMSPYTFVADLLKGWALTAVLGGIILSIVLWFFAFAGAWAWLYCWLAVVAFELSLLFIAPVVIMPLFNKFTPLGEGELKTAIEDYARAQNFQMRGIFVMDGSRRSNKSNAFFTGFGRFRRIALFDTLVKNHSTDELVSILAHEVGHYKKKHVFKHVAFSVAAGGLMFFLLSFFINNPGLFAAFKMEYVSVYAGLLFFGFLYSPIQTFFSVITNVFSRRWEYEADRFAADTYRKPQALAEALKKLSVNNLSNLNPHPWKVFLHYSHPPVLERIGALRKMG